MTLHLNAFRGEPAIAKFDWSFAPYHRSSPPFSTDVCSVLHGVLPPLQPAHGKITWLRVYSMRLNALFRLAFAPASHLWLTLPHTITRRLILQKARGHGDPKVQTLPRLVGTRFQALFHSPPGVLFTFPSRYLSAIGHQGVFRLSGWSRQIHTGFHGPRATWEFA